jgi:hypothetical protein
MVATLLAVLIPWLVVGGAVVALFLYRQYRHHRRHRRDNRKEPFLGAIGTILKIGSMILAPPAAVDFIVRKVKKNKKPVPTYRGRVWDGADWSCPDGTVETGSKDDFNACMTSQFHPPVWKSVGGTWDWHCPNGTVPTTDKTWEKKCEVGWAARIQQNGKWACPSGTTDSGSSWEKSTWAEAQKQCRRSGAYTVRIQNGQQWQCPDGSTDTKRTWSTPFPWNQCKWSGP